MSKPSPGRYYIVNQAVASDGEFLALTYDDRNVNVTLTMLRGNQSAQVVIKDYGGDLQTVSPQDAADHRQVDLDWGQNRSGYLKITDSQTAVWIIRGSHGNYTFQDSEYSYFWNIRNTAVGEHVRYSSPSDSERSKWKLINA